MSPSHVLLALVLSAAPAEPAAPPAPERIDLPTLITRARTGPSVEVARAAARQAHAKAIEVGRLWTPQIEIVAVGGPSQRITCFPSVDDCERTEPTQIGLGFEGVFGRVDGKLFMPVFTFGKITAGTDAAEAAARAHEALAVQGEHGAALDAARAYFAVKAGRELKAMLQEGLGLLDQELAREEEQLAEGSGDVTDADRRRVLTLRAEVLARLSEARKVEELGLAGVHYILGTDRADLDPVPLRQVAYTLPSREQARSLASRRPEHRAAAAAVEATGRLVDLEWNKWWPDFIVIGAGTLAASTSVQHPNNAFLNDPYNNVSGALGLALRWAPDLFTRLPRIEQAEAEQARARATAKMAEDGLAAEAEKVWSEARDARDRIAASRDGQKHGKAWLASVLQSEAAGLVEPKELAEALLQYFMMRARLIQATAEWNVAVVTLQRATGELPGTLSYVEED